jgi:hypothetical protein
VAKQNKKDAANKAKGIEKFLGEWYNVQS